MNGFGFETALSCMETSLEFRVHYLLPKNCVTSSVIVEAGTREEAEFVAAVQYEFPSGTRVLDANPYNIYGLAPTAPRLGLYWEVRKRIEQGYYDEWPLVPEERSRRRRQLFKEVAAIFGTRQGHEHLFDTAERLARQFRLAGKTTISGGIAAIVDQHPLINLLDRYQQLKLVADNVAKAPTRGDPMEVVKPVDNRVGSRVRRKTRQHSGAKTRGSPARRLGAGSELPKQCSSSAAARSDASIVMQCGLLPPMTRMPGTSRT